MTTSITDISGVGTATAEILRRQGYNTIDDLAAANVDDLAALHGFGVIRAQQIIDLARNHLTNIPAPENQVAVVSEEPASEEVASAPSKKKKKKKKKKKDKAEKSSKKKDKKRKKEKKKESKKKKGSKKEK